MTTPGPNPKPKLPGTLSPSDDVSTVHDPRFAVSRHVVAPAGEAKPLEIAPDEHPREKPRVSCPACARMMDADAQICVDCGYDHRKGFTEHSGIGAGGVIGGGIECPYCGYDLRGLKQPKCPECGNLIEREDLVRTPRKIKVPITREMIVRPLIMLVCGLIVAGTVQWLGVSPKATLQYLVGFPIVLGCGMLAYLMVASWILGFDLPMRVVTLKMAAVYACVDAALFASALTPWWLALLPLIGIAYWLLLAKELDLDWTDALILAALAFVIRVVVGGQLLAMIWTAAGW